LRGILGEFGPDLYQLAPIPLFYKQLDDPDLTSWNQQLVQDARGYFDEQRLDVPDERHADSLGHVPEFPDTGWSEPNPPAVGIWHCVPTNRFLDLDKPAVQRLRARIEASWRGVLEQLHPDDGRPPLITESWIQFYKDGDRKVLHNHERYGEPFYERMWAGAYYLDDGDPHPHMKYAGLFSFQLRGENHYIRPKPGLLMMWPADLLHEVHTFYGSRPRVVLNFNICADPGARRSRLRRVIRKIKNPKLPF
jgi:hypothetical protein